MLRKDPDIQFQVPDDWQDKSITAFAAPLQAGQSIAANVVITRDALPPGKTARDYADGQLVELSKRLEGFQLRRRNEFELNGQAPAVVLDFTWRSGTNVLRQWEIFCGAGEGRALSIVFTALETDFAKFESQFAAVVNSIQLEATR